MAFIIFKRECPALSDSDQKIAPGRAEARPGGQREREYRDGVERAAAAL